MIWPAGLPIDQARIIAEEMARADARLVAREMDQLDGSIGRPMSGCGLLPECARVVNLGGFPSRAFRTADRTLIGWQGKSDTMDRNVETVRALYAAVGDPADDLRRFFTPDVIISEAPDLPYGGTFIGPGALRPLVTRINGLITATNVAVGQFAVAENQVIAMLSFDVALPDGSARRQHVAEEFLFDGELIRQIRPFYYDTSLINRAAGLSAQ